MGTCVWPASESCTSCTIAASRTISASRETISASRTTPRLLLAMLMFAAWRCLVADDPWTGSRYLDVKVTASQTNLGQEGEFNCTVTFDPDLRPSLRVELFNEEGRWLYSWSEDLGSEELKLDNDGQSSPRQVTVTLHEDHEVRLTLWFAEVRCSERSVLTCRVAWQGDNSTAVSSVSKSLAMTVFVLPQPPKAVTFSPASTADGLEPAWPKVVLEGELMTATISAVLGEPGKGELDLSFHCHRHGLTRQLTNWPDITSVTEPVSRSLADQCVETVLFNVRFRIYRQHQNCSLAVFVLNTDFPRSTENVCLNQSTQLCLSSHPLVVYYPVSARTMEINGPVHTVHPGSVVSLMCSAPGFPEPTSAWYRGHSSQSLLSGQPLTTDAVLILTDIASSDSDVYMCVVQNEVFGTVYEASTVYYLNITERHLVGNAICYLPVAVLAVVLLLSAPGLIWLYINADRKRKAAALTEQVTTGVRASVSRERKRPVSASTERLYKLRQDCERLRHSRHRLNSRLSKMNKQRARSTSGAVAHILSIETEL